MANKSKPESLGSVSLGAKIVFGIAETLDPHSRNATPPSLGHRIFTVVGFKPRNKNNVVLQDSSGTPLLMPLHIVEFALRSESQKQFRYRTTTETEKQPISASAPSSQCEASRSTFEYQPCNRCATHVAELTLENGEHKALLLCRKHASTILDKRYGLDEWSDLKLTPFSAGLWDRVLLLKVGTSGT